MIASDAYSSETTDTFELWLIVNTRKQDGRDYLRRNKKIKLKSEPIVNCKRQNIFRCFRLETAKIIKTHLQTHLFTMLDWSWKYTSPLCMRSRSSPGQCSLFYFINELSLMWVDHPYEKPRKYCIGPICFVWNFNSFYRSLRLDV